MHGQVLARFGQAVSDPPRSRLLRAHALPDLLGVVLAVDAGTCPAAVQRGCS